MNKTALLLLAVFCFAFAKAQKNNELTLETDVDLLVTDISIIENELNSFIETKGVTPEKYYKSKYYINISLLLDFENYLAFEKLIEKKGYIKKKNTNSKNYAASLKTKEHEIEILQKEKAQYEKLVADSARLKNERTFDYWEKIISIEKDISKLKLEQEEILRKHKKYKYKLEVREEENSTQDYSESWINMPGFEYSLLFTEQPEAGISLEQMQGYCLKYMFNYGKTYIVLGLFQNTSENITTEIDEIYMFAFGQDFYSKRLGRGQRKFLNLYTSFNVGVYIATNQDDNYTSWFTNPFLGLELFKNKYFLIDTKVGYFLPYKNNRTQRGLLYNASFNFVF